MKITLALFCLFTLNCFAQIEPQSTNKNNNQNTDNIYNNDDLKNDMAVLFSEKTEERQLSEKTGNCVSTWF